MVTINLVTRFCKYFKIYIMWKRLQRGGGHLTVATKFPNQTMKYFAQTGIQVEIIRLYGSMELAPILG